MCICVRSKDAQKQLARTSLNDLQSKRKTKEDQGEEFGEQKTSIARCHPTLLVHCMIAHMMAAITHVNLKAEINCKKDPWIR